MDRTILDVKKRVRPELFKIKILSSFARDFFTKQSPQLTKQMYHSMNNMDLKTIKILKYGRNPVVLFTIFLYFDPRNKCVVADDGVVAVVSLLPVPGLVHGAPQS